MLTVAELDGRRGEAAADGDLEGVGDADVVAGGAAVDAVGDVAEAERVGVERRAVRRAARRRRGRRAAEHEVPAREKPAQGVAAVLAAAGGGVAGRRGRRREARRRGDHGEDEEMKLGTRHGGIDRLRLIELDFCMVRDVDL